MRAWVWMAAFFLATPAWGAAQRSPIVPPDPLIPHWDVSRFVAADPQNNGLPDFARMGSARDGSEDETGKGLSLGPIHAESETINGHRRVHYRVDGVSVLGGDVGCSMSGHGAMLSLHWQSSGE